MNPGAEGARAFFAVGGSALVKGGGVRIRLMAERTAKPGVLARGVFFEGGDVLRCYRGRFRFTLDGGGGKFL